MIGISSLALIANAKCLWLLHCTQSNDAHKEIKQYMSINTMIFFYIFNATLLLLHEIESAYEKEWEILKLPGKITGFLIMHIPVIILLLWGLIELYKQSATGMIIGIVAGLGGLMPFIIHKILVKRDNHFNRPISIIIMILNVITGIGTAVLSLQCAG